MNRFQRKCFIASTGFHLALMLVLVVGPAFMSRNSKTPNVPLINFVPVKTVDDAMSGGGYKDGGPPPQAAPAPTPPAPIAKPDPAPVVEPDPPAAVPKPDVKQAADTNPKPSRPKPDISTVPVVRKTDSSEKTKAQKAAADAQAAADRKRLAAAFNSAASGIQSGIAGSTAIKLQGPGGGGVPYANWFSAVETIYQRAWMAPDGLDEHTPAVTAEITIAKDGSVISAHVIRGSGNAAADDSVRATLLRVKFAAPLPDTETRDRRTITIDFINDKARRLLG